MDMFKVTQLDVADMSVHINSGTIIYNNQVINFSEQDSEILQAPRIGTWLVVLSINSKGHLPSNSSLNKLLILEVNKFISFCV